MAIKQVDPISRIEGHLGVELTTAPDASLRERVTIANVHGNLWRGFENFLIGRNPNDAITFTQRICGVCPVPHGTTAAYAIDAVYGYNDNFQTFSTLTAPAGKGVPPKALHIRNLVLSAEFLMSSLTHFYHLAAPSYVQGPNMPPWTPYFADTFYHPLLRSATHGTDGGAGTGVLPLMVDGFSKDLWSAVIKQYVKALRIRRLTFEAGALFAGRMPMTSTLVAGGVSFDKSEDLTTKCQLFWDLMTEVGKFIVKEYVPVVLALGALYPNYDNLANATTLNSVAPTLWSGASAENTVAPAALNTGYGAGCGNFLAWGAFPQTDGSLGCANGFSLAGAPATTITTANVLAGLREHVAHSRYDFTSADALAAGYTVDGISDPAVVNRTIPDRVANAAKYSWLKAPRWNGSPAEVGPLARLVVAGIYKTTAGANALATTVPGYGAYTKTVGAVTGLDPVMIEADLAVALVREGLATLTVGATIIASTTGLTNAQIVAAYTDPAAVITGTAAAWVINLVGGLSNMDRLRGRAIESLVLVQRMLGLVSKSATAISFPALVKGASLPATRPTPVVFAPTPGGSGWLQQLQWENDKGIADTYASKAVPTGRVFGFGANEAPRGALMHMATIDGGKIVAYQCIVPTTWNGAPKDAANVSGPMEQAMLGIPYDPATKAFTGGGGTALVAGGGVEALRVAQSFDPCIACAVH